MHQFIEERVVYMRVPNDADGFQLSLIKALASQGIEVIDESYGGETRSLKISPNEVSSYNVAPKRVGISYAYEPLYGWGAPITMSFQGKAIDYQTGKLLLTYSITRGTHGERLTDTAKAFAAEIAKLFKKAATQQR
jgi:hypothetical protein